MLDYAVEDLLNDAEKLAVKVMGDGIIAVFQVPEGATEAQSLVLSYDQVRQLVAIAENH